MVYKVRCEQCGRTSQFSSSDAGLTALCVACGARFTIPSGDDASGAGGDGAAAGSPAPMPADDALAALGSAAAGAESANAARRLAELAPARSPYGAAQPPPPPPPPVIDEKPFDPMREVAVRPLPAPSRVAVFLATERPGVTVGERAGRSGGGPRRGPGIGLVYGLLGCAVTVAVILAAAGVFRGPPSSPDDPARVAVRDLKARAEAQAAAGQFQEAYDTYRRIDEVLAGRPVTDPELRADVGRAAADRDELFRRLLARVREQHAAGGGATTNPTGAAGGAVASNGTDAAVGTLTTTAPAGGGSTTAPAGTTVAAAAAPPERPEEFGPWRAQEELRLTMRSWPDYVPRPLLPDDVAADPTPVAPAARAVAAATQAATTAPAPAGGDIVVTRRPPAPPRGLTDDAIGRAIQRGVDHLLAQFHDGAMVGAEGGDAYQTGLNALCAYALMQSALAIKDDRISLRGPLVRQMADKMKAMRADSGPVTYARGIRVTALALLNRPQDRQAINADVNYLLATHHDGAFTYQGQPGTLSSAGGRRRENYGWDNSNSQYGLLGVWSGAEVGAEVNTSFWAAVDGHWEQSQNPNGSWEYAASSGRGSGRLSMTLGGVASLFVTHDYLDAPKVGAQVGREPFSPHLARALAHLEEGQRAVSVQGGYSLYGLERVGLASGFKYFGDHDWYRHLAAAVVRSQGPDGSWGDPVETAFHLLFLARGRHPVIMNKLRYDGYWANRPRDIANLARFASKELERPLNWQVVPVTRDWTDWTDSPVLYVSSHVAPRLSEAELEKVRSFVRAGGLLFTQADGGGPEADRWARDVAAKLFAPYPLKDLGDDHELWSTHYKPGQRPRLQAVSNGARLLMVHAPADITQHWQLRRDRAHRATFELGVNLFLYAAGKGDLRNRLASTYIPEVEVPAGGGRIAVARVRYGGNWDPEPAAWERFGRYFQRETDVALDVRAVDLQALDVSRTKFAHWTGTDAYTPTPAEVDAVRKFVEAGGVLLIEPCGGAGEFYESARAAVAKALPDAKAQMVPKAHPMLTASGPGMDDVASAQVRQYVRNRGIGTGGRLDMFASGKGRVIINPLDLTAGILGAPTWGISGFEPGYALQLVKNVVLWTATGMRE
jgi:hypothetical protein